MSLEILRVTQITKSYGSKLVLDGIDLNLNRGERIALVGENGVGKSTLSRMITGEEEADSGTIRLLDGAELGYLPQEVSGDEGMTVRAYIEQAMGTLNRLRETMQALEQRMTQPLSEMEMSVVLEEYGEVQAEFEQRGGYEIENRIAQIFAGLSIDYIEQERLLMTLSGGERTRVALTALLLREPELLILDEPTNHLDFAGIAWLENYLADYPNALLLITHDRTFINRVANQISELNATTKTLQHYHGNYENYLTARQREYEEQVAAYNAQKNDMKALQRTVKQLSHNRKITGAFTDIEDKFLKNFKKERGEGLISREVREARKLLDDLQENKLANPRHEWNVDFRFAPLELGSAEPLRFEGLSKSFGETVIFENLTAIVPKGERVVLVAPNGTGKSTLLRLIMGLQTADSGKVVMSPSVRIGYLDQDGETLDGEKTVLEVFRQYMQGSDSELMAELHRSGLFADSALVKKQVRDLSVGQRRKLGLACIIANKANLLLLDEPTNHLDLLSLEALEEALIGFGGTILAVSHDRRFVEKVATQVWEIKNKSLKPKTQGDTESMKLSIYTDERLGDLQAAFMRWRSEDTTGTNLCHAGDIPHRIYNGIRGRLPVSEIVQIYEPKGEIRAFTLGQPYGNGFDVFTSPSIEKSELKELIDCCYRVTREQMNAIGRADKAVNTDADEADTMRHEVLAELGFEKGVNWMNLTQRSLDEPIDEPKLLEGFVIRPATMDDYEQLAAVHSSAFGSSWTPELYRDEVMKKPGYVPEHEMVVVAPDGRFAAFTVTWRDEVNKIGYFEPVGAHSDFQRKGLSRAMMLHTLKLMKAEGMKSAEVAHEIDNLASSALYASVGFKLHGHVWGYSKQ